MFFSKLSPSCLHKIRSHMKTTCTLNLTLVKISDSGIKMKLSRGSKA